MAALFCESCLKIEINENFGAFAQDKMPLGSGESAEGFLSRQIGFVVLPLTLTQKKSELLVEEIKSDWLEEIPN